MPMRYFAYILAPYDTRYL